MMEGWNWSHFPLNTVHLTPPAVLQNMPEVAWRLIEIRAAQTPTCNLLLRHLLVICFSHTYLQVAKFRPFPRTNIHRLKEKVQ